MPMNWKSKIILSKIETTYGVDSVPTGALNAMLMTNVTFDPMEGDDASRDLEQPYLSAQEEIPVGLRGRLKGRIELAPSGSLGVAPSWGPMMRACGVAQVVNAGVSVIYNPISNNMESVTNHMWIEGTRHVFVGSRGNLSMQWTAQAVPYFEIDMLGLFVDPSEVARPTPTLTGFQPPVVVTKANTPVFNINSVPMVARSMRLNFNNVVDPRLLVGSESIIIPDRKDLFSCQVEATPLTTFNPFALAKQRTRVPISIVHGTVAGKIATLSIPSAQLKRPKTPKDAQNIYEWPLELIPLPVSGNDQWTLTLT
jgi:hypothetical protein